MLACEAVHISLDIDCLDPAAAPGTFLNPQAALNLRYVIQCPARPPGLVQLWIMRRLRSESETIGGSPRRINP